MYRIAIPSYNRFDILQSKTLKLLSSYNIDFTKIDLFLENQEQYDLYYTALERDTKNHDINIIITDTMGIGAKRNFIRKYYRDDTDEKYIFCIDDDIDMVMNMEDELVNLDNFIQTAFTQTENRNLCIWGVSAFHNPFFLKDIISTNLKYICGAFYGLIIDRDKELLQTEYNHYEDFEFSIKHFKRDGGVVRFNNVAIKTKYFGEGGINNSYGGLDNRKKDMEVAGLRFAKQYSGFCRLIKKKYGFDIRLNWRCKYKTV